MDSLNKIVQRVLIKLHIQNFQNLMFGFFKFEIRIHTVVDDILAVGQLPQDTGLGSIQELVPLVITRETEKFPDYKRNNWCVGQRKNNPHFPLQKVCKVQNIKTSFLNKINLQMYRFHRAQT